MARRLSDYFNGARCFSSSVQFRTMLIFAGVPGSDPVPAGIIAPIIRKRLPSGLMSHCAIGILIEKVRDMTGRPKEQGNAADARPQALTRISHKVS